MHYLALFIGACTLAIATANTQCTAETKTLDAAKQSKDALIDFSLALYHNISQLKPDSNVIFSPVSIALALALMESGASGQTRAEIQNVLKRADSNAHILSVYKSLQHHLKVDEDKVKLTIANGFYAAPGFPIKDEFKTIAEQCFEAKADKTDFAGDLENSRKKINKFVSDATNEKIPELWKEGVLTQDVVAVIVNALYFAGAWKNKFEVESIRPLPFYTKGGDTPKTVQFITGDRQIPYISQAQFDAVELPFFGDNLFGMYIILPKQRNGLESVASSIDSSLLTTLVSTQEQTDTTLTMPKFSIRTSFDLKTILMNMGVSTMFTPGADFSRMTSAQLQVSKAVHEAFIKVNENGTEAAAATGFAFIERSPRVTKEFKVDHPFLYYIIHKPTGAPIFMGKVVDVVEEQ